MGDSDGDFAATNASKTASREGPVHAAASEMRADCVALAY